ncbi:GntR family transcriptional regulator [Scopulibacillus darangshiensis]|uniref:GntR family transcriptional regulator n=1 Tax=Scopulibacillus darangshiensis TaxID=442528 RepID=A0A4R2P8E8_9BACL|nr:GntR family transcriptional regulator [Scopulibacillus darangshiensis]TCP30578.1 GntR family transcriptional regulator [Scopulibacillus darangshiensis]
MGGAFNTSTPIYIQLGDRINHQIIRGELLPGDKLPSVREMAVQAGVNPNTVQRTYRELERMEIVESRRGQGTFVTENEDILVKLREQLKEMHISHFVGDMKMMGYTENEMINGLRHYLDVNREEDGLS